MFAPDRVDQARNFRRCFERDDPPESFNVASGPGNQVDDVADREIMSSSRPT
jgi:hypothetical protein